MPFSSRSALDGAVPAPIPAGIADGPALTGDLRGYAARLGLDAAAVDRDRASSAVADRIRRDVASGLAAGRVPGTPTLFTDGVAHRAGCHPPAPPAALTP